MLINRILNNNVVITEDTSGEDMIVMGKGIGYQKAKGDIIEYAQDKLNKKLNERIYISLSDHKYTAIKRIKDRIVVKNDLLWEIKHFYKYEFEIGMKALDIIEKRTNIRLPDDEAGFIAFHIVNAELNEEQTMVQVITKIIQEILTIVRIHFGIEFKEESVFYYRFITHLKFFAERLFSDKTYNGSTGEELLDIIKCKYSEEFECILKIKTFIQKKYKYNLTSDEMIYLTIHIAKIIQDLKL